MHVRLFHIDAFTNQRFRGNPAAVMPLEDFPADAVMQAIAAENNLSETAFIVPQGDDYRLRWFTPAVEVPLCGHATLASAAVVMERLHAARQQVTFHTASGPLTVKRAARGYAMDFPARPIVPVSEPAGLAPALGIAPVEVHANDVNYVAVLRDERAVIELSPDIAAIARLDRSGLIVTARGTGDRDIVSRYFTPARGVAEDPVTGSAHCALAPFWSQRLGKSALRAYQASRRGGEMTCRIRGQRVELEGTCVFYLEGTAEL
jgi:PhzF family phenazine biosynthesis protein